MPSIKYKDSTTGNMLPVSVKVGDTLPVGTEIDYDGESVPLGWEQVADGDLIVSPTEPSGNDRRKVWLKHSSNLLNKDIWTNAYINSSGNIVSGDNYALFSYIAVKPNTSYTIKTKTSVYLMTVTEYNNSYSFIQRNVSSTDINEYLFTTTANTKYVRLVIQSFSSITITQSIINGLEIMVNEGTTSLPYEPYVEDKIFILNSNNVYEEYDTNNDTGLVNVSLNSGFTGTLTVRKVGKTVNVIGTSITGNFVGGTAFATIPEGFRPSDQINYVGRNVSNESMFLMNQNSLGAIRSLTSFSNATLQFSFTYLVD